MANQRITKDGSIAWTAPEVFRAIAPLYKKYDGFDHPQPVLLCLSEDGIVSVETDGEPGDAVPARVWLGRDLRWRLPSEISLSGVESVRGDLWPMLERVYLGHSTEWDGSNHVGRLSADGQEAELEIQGYLYNGLADCRCDKVQSAMDWLGELGAHDLVSDDQTLEQALESIQDQAEADGVYIHDLDLESLAALLGERPDEELGPRHRAILQEYFR